MEQIIFVIIILFILWIICNSILKNLLNKCREFNEMINAALNYRKSIMFDILVLLCVFIFDVNIIRYIAIIYYIVIALFEGILIIISCVSGIKDDVTNNCIDKDLWILLFSKVLNELASIIMIIELLSL